MDLKVGNQACKGSKGTVHLLDKHPGDNIYYPRGEKYSKTSTKKKQHSNITYSFKRN